MRLPRRVRADGLRRMRPAYCRGRGRPTGTVAGIDLGVRGGAYPAVRGWDMLHLEELKTRAKKLKRVGEGAGDLPVVPWGA